MNTAPHHRLLRALACLAPDAGHVRALAADPALDAAAFLDAAARHKLLPLAGRHVHRHHLDRGPGALPHPWVLTSAYVANRARNTALADEFSGVQRELTEHQVRWALRKGFALAEGVYGDPGVRRIGDLDLALHPDDTARAHTTLTRLGYVQGELATDGDHVVPYAAALKADGPARGDDGEFLPYRKAGLRPGVPEFYVDLCPALPEPPLGLSEIPMADVLERSRAAVRCGSPARELHPADQLIDLWAQLRGPARALLEGRPDGGFLPLAKLLDVALLSASLGDADWALTEALLARPGLWPALDSVPRLTALVFPGSTPAAFAGAADAAPGLTARLTS
ncbi:nucleotidyltransferase family protein [Streptomyces roseirectus]|uniref:Nucleotidyltransferase family protein n=1 Tax=Streptomyces roseirectus TaxID=2768066 RepID=A0A7H0IQH2_9ACTN|nr:nucleotidyltransferase family protein [Streptomyces roseirectus]QNP75038.1 nucleotidyltransferase family protein [Streptomyces roseirectus]